MPDPSTSARPLPFGMARIRQQRWIDVTEARLASIAKAIENREEVQP